MWSWIVSSNWTSNGNKKLDEAKGFDNHYYIEWIPYDDLKNIRKIGEGGFATVYQGEWSNGPRFVRDNKRYCYTNGSVALKKLKNSQNISDEFLKEVNILI